MRLIKFIGILFITFAIISLTAVTNALARPGVLPTNHYMAQNIRLTPNDSSSTDATLAHIVQPTGKAVIFKTLDQFTCNKGDYEIILRIIRMDDNLVVTFTKPIPFTAPQNGFVFTQPAVWQVYFPFSGVVSL